MQKIGIIGGTFSPIHIGHLMLAQRALEEYHLDEIVFIPNGNPPHKKASLDASFRAEMVKLAIKDHPGFTFSDFEIRKEAFSYTSDTLAEFCSLNPDAEYYFIVGADSLDYMEQWHEPQKIFDCAVILAGPRGNLDLKQMEQKIQELKEKYNARINLLHMPNFEISSNWIRQAVKEGYSIRYYVTEEVENYIEEHGLYR